MYTTQTEKSLDGLTNRLEMIEEIVSEPEDRSTETIQSEEI